MSDLDLKVLGEIANLQKSIVNTEVSQNLAIVLKLYVIIFITKDKVLSNSL